MSLGVHSPDFEPIQILQVEISQPLPTVSAIAAGNNRTYRRANALVRLHTQPIGIVELTFDKCGLSAEEYANLIWENLHQAINAHLHQDGLPQITYLDKAGITCHQVPHCICERVLAQSQAPFVSIIVATRERPESLAMCLEQLLQLAYTKYEIIVVDNAPITDATATLLRERYGHLSHVHYFREDQPGQSCAINRGLQHAQGEIVAFTDDDVLVDRHWLSGLVNGFAVSDNVACVNGLVLPAELETPAQVWFEQYGGLGFGFDRHIYDMADNRLVSPFYPYTGSPAVGANMALKASVCRELGGFDPLLAPGAAGLGGGDLDLCYRLLTSGYQVVYEPAALAHHVHRREYTQLCKQMYAYGVGLLAYLTKCLLAEPRRIPTFAALVPYGIYLVLWQKSLTRENKKTNYPPELTWLERKGMVWGPFAYLRARWFKRHETTLVVRQSYS